MKYETRAEYENSPMTFWEEFKSGLLIGAGIGALICIGFFLGDVFT